MIWQSLPSLLHDASIQSIALASRSTLETATGKASATYTRFVASLSTQLTLTKPQIANILAFHEGLHGRRASFTAPELATTLGLSHHTLKFETEPVVTWHGYHAASIDFSVRCLGVIDSGLEGFEPCGYLLLPNTVVRELSSQTQTEWLGGWLHRTGKRYGKQYALDVALKCPLSAFKAFLNWYQNDLKGGSKAFSISQLGKLDHRLNQKKAIWSGGFSAQVTGGFVNISGTWWVSNEL